MLLAGKINLKEVLLKNKFAVYDQATFFADLLESPNDEDCFPSYMMKTLSICGNGPPVDTSLSTAGGERQHSSNLDITTDSVSLILFSIFFFLRIGHLSKTTLFFDWLPKGTLSEPDKFRAGRNLEQ